VATLLQQSGEARVEIAKPLLFNRKMKKVEVFINAAYLYLRMKMTGESESTKMAWILSYVQRGVVET